MNLDEQKKTTLKSLKSVSRKNKIIAIAAISLLVLAATSFLYFRGPKQSLIAMVKSLPNRDGCSQITFYDLAYDVRRTDSIVSKYVSTISGIYTLNNAPKNGGYNFAITLSYINWKWVLNKADVRKNNTLSDMTNMFIPCFK